MLATREGTRNKTKLLFRSDMTQSWKKTGKEKMIQMVLKMNPNTVKMRN